LGSFIALASKKRNVTLLFASRNLERKQRGGAEKKLMDGEKKATDWYRFPRLRRRCGKRAAAPRAARRGLRASAGRLYFFDRCTPFLLTTHRIFIAQTLSMGSWDTEA